MLDRAINEEAGVVCDFRPIVKFGKLEIYAPTEEKVKRVLAVKKLIYYMQNGENCKVSQECYKATTRHIAELYEKKESEVQELSLFKGKKLTRDEIIALYQ